MSDVTLCPCGKEPRRAAGKWGLNCEAASKRRVRASTADERGQRRAAAQKAKADAKRRADAARKALTETPEFRREVKETKRYVVTAAQNNTLVHPGFLAALKTYVATTCAELIVIPYRYKNPTGMQPGRDLRDCCAKRIYSGRCLLPKDHTGECVADELWWDPTLEPYLLNQRLRLNANCVVAGDVKIQATASDPLSGFEALTAGESCVIGHPRLALKTVASFEWPKILTTTGAVTQKNYSNTKAGALGEFHHVFGATLVEVDGKIFHLRQLLGEDQSGAFFDVAGGEVCRYSGTGVTRGHRLEAVLTGDTHVRITDPDVDRATFGPGGMFETLRPRAWIVNDLNDGETVNPHEDGDIFKTIARQKAGRTDVKAELEDSARYIQDREHLCDEVVIVHSNHDDFLRRWVVKLMREGCRDAKNARVFLETALYLEGSAQMTPGGADYGDPFAWWMKQLGASKKVRCLRRNESYLVKGIQVGGHGHSGPQGSRGGMKNLARVGVKVFDAHSHTKGIFEGHWRVGTSSARTQAYHNGPGSNLNAHGGVYPNSKRVLLTIIVTPDGPKWRL